MSTKTERRPGYGNGVRDQLPGQIMDAYITSAARSQYLSSRFGLPAHRAALIAGLAFGEAGHAR